MANRSGENEVTMIYKALYNILMFVQHVPITNRDELMLSTIVPAPDVTSVVLLFKKLGDKS
jgi:hypothetical protein